MRKTTSILLDDESEAFIEQQIAVGHYNNPNEVVTASLRRMKEESDYLEAVRQALEEGEASGIAEDFTFEDFFLEMRERYAARG